MTTLRTQILLAAALTASLLAAAPSTALAQDAPAAPLPTLSMDGPRPPPPPPGFGLKGAPVGYYAAPDEAQPPPKQVEWEAPIPRLRRNPQLAATGGAVMGAGLLTFFIGLGMQISNTECHTELYILPACRQKDAGVDTAAKGTMIAGGATLFIGLPIMIVGLRKTPVKENEVSLAGHPTPTGWAWHF